MLKKRVLSIILMAIVLASAAVPAFADGTGDDGTAHTPEAVTVVGGDLNVTQLEQVYKTFGVKRGDVKEVVMTFAEEKAYLSGKVPADKLGSRSISSAYIKPSASGSGITVRTENITWVTAEMYISALSTAGLADADIVVAAPFKVSGTAALAGIFKAYEVSTGEALPDAAKEVAGDEMILTGELSDVLGSKEAVQLMNELKKILAEVKTMDDATLLSTIESTAKQFNITLSEEQKLQIMGLLRKMAELNIDPTQLLTQAQNLQKAFENMSKAGEKTQTFFTSVANFFNNIGEWFKKLFGIK